MLQREYLAAYEGHEIAFESYLQPIARAKVLVVVLGQCHAWCGVMDMKPASSYHPQPTQNFWYIAYGITNR